MMRYIIPLLLTSVTTPALAEVPNVVTDLPAVHALATQVMDGVGSPVLLLDRGANAHSFQLRPSQAAALADADIVFWVGPEMTPWLDRALDGLSESATRLALLDAPGTFVRGFGDAEKGDHDDHGHDEHGHDDHGHDDHAEATQDDGHNHDGVDPHAWLDPANAMLWTDLMAKTLAQADPGNADTYAANAAKAQAAIAALDGELRTLLAPIQDRPFVVFHDAYRYFADHYGLSVAGAIALGDATSPGAARLADLQATMTDGRAVCIFPEAQHDPALVQQMAEASGARIGAALDPSGSTLDPGAGNYAELLRNMAFALNECLNQ